MNALKVAISMPSDLLATIDNIRKKQGVSRSKFIASVLREKVRDQQQEELKKAYDRVFSDKNIQAEQLETARLLNGADSSEGQEW